jgi:hypothetical protein
MGIKKGKGNLGVKDYVDYGREMATKGELHALDTASGGLFGSRSANKLRPILPVWEDRNTDNIGSKLNGPKNIKSNLKKQSDYKYKKATKKSNG